MLDKNLCKRFQNNSQNYGSSYTEDNINKESLTLSVLPRQNPVMKYKSFSEPPNQITRFAMASITWNFDVFETEVFKYFVLQNAAKIL